MKTEKDIEELLAEELLGMIKKPKYNTNVETFCKEYHLDRANLTSKRLFSMKNRTLFRIMLGIAQLVPFKDFVKMCIRIAKITYGVASKDDGSAEAHMARLCLRGELYHRTVCAAPRVQSHVVPQN